MATHGHNDEGFTVLDDFVCEAVHARSIALADPARQGQNEGVSVVEELLVELGGKEEEFATAEAAFRPGEPKGVSVRFQFADAAVLFCVPAAGCDLNHLVERYICFERIAIPSYQEVAGFLSRAVHAGAILVSADNLYRLTPEWYARVHQRDHEITQPELAVIEFAEELEADEWSAVGAEFVLPPDEYERAAKHARQYLDRLFVRHR
jgi:hypothetical protein